MSEDILFDEEARGKIMTGIKKTADAVKATLGPKGQNVLIKTGPDLQHFTKDGITVARSVVLSDRFENMGAQIAKEAGNRSVKACGDGTSTSITLLDGIVQEGKRQMALGVDPMSIRRGIDAASKYVSQFIKDESVPLSGVEDLRRVATISANNDAKVGSLIAETIDRVGPDATITLEKGYGSKEHNVIFTNGFEWDCGFISETFVSNADNQTFQYSTQNEKDFAAYVWVANARFSSLSDNFIKEGFLKVVREAHATGYPLIIVAESVDTEALNTLVNAVTKNGLKVCAVRAPSYGQDRIDTMGDIAAFTGGRIRKTESGEDLFKDWSIKELGKVKSVIVSENKTIFLPCDFNKKVIEARVDDLVKKIESVADASKKPGLVRRKSMLTGGIANIIVGGMTDSEVREQYDLFEDALLAARAASKGGIVPGAGTMLVRASKALNKFKAENNAQKIGVQILQNALLIPFQEIIKNGGSINPEVVLEKVSRNKNKSYGYDSNKDEYCDLLKRGIIDPALVVRSAVEHSSSYAALVLSTKVVINIGE